MSVLPRLAASTAADSSVAFDNLLFGNKHNMTSFRRLVITVIKHVRTCVFVCARARMSVCACVKMDPSEITKVCVVCGGEKEKAEAEPRSDNVCQRLRGLFCTGSFRPCGGVATTDKQANKQTMNYTAIKLERAPVVQY